MSTINAAAQTSAPRSIISRKSIGRAISAIITVSLLAYLLSKINWPEFEQIAHRVSAASFLAIILTYFLLNFFRALRFRALLNRPETPLSKLVPITLYHNFLVRVLPFKIGELSYIVLMRSNLNYTVQEGISSLVGARLLELLVIVAGGVLGVAITGENFTEDHSSLITIIVIGFVTCVIGLYFSGRIIRFSAAIIERMTPSKSKGSRALAQILTILEKTATEFEKIKQPRPFIMGLFFSLLTYSSSFISNYIMLNAVGVQADAGTIIAIISIGMFATAFPFSISGFGVIEASWAFGLTSLAGYGVSEATSIGFLMHGIQIIAASLFGLIGYLTIRERGPEEKN